jgi:hypothetical protein
MIIAPLPRWATTSQMKFSARGRAMPAPDVRHRQWRAPIVGKKDEVGACKAKAARRSRADES